MCIRDRVWGDNSEGQLGIADREDRDAPALNTNAAPLGVVGIACGTRHSLLLLRNGSVAGFGYDPEGLALPLRAQSAASPTAMRLPAARRWRAVVAGPTAGHALAIADNGAATVWGRNDRAQLGVAAAGVSVRTPHELPAPQPLAAACVCLLYTSPSPRDQRGSRMPSSA